MKNLLGKILIALPITALALAVLLQGTKTTNANPSGVQVYTNATSTTNSLATTTAQAPYLKAATATSSVEFDPVNGNVIQLSMSAYSSTTPATVRAELQMSNNGVDWYAYETGATGNPDSLLAGQVGDGISWLASTSTADQTVYKTVPLTTNFAAKYGRLQYWISGGSSQVHIELALKKEY